MATKHRPLSLSRPFRPVPNSYAASRFHVSMGIVDMAYGHLGVLLGACGLPFLIYALIHGPRALGSFLSRQSRSDKASSIGFSTTFPPSQRALLARVAPTALSAADGPDAAFDLSASPRPVLEFESDYRLADPATFLFSGFTVGEVRALGDFPNYAELSGVPLPGSAPDFDIDSASPRPYRPFRWPYHQTMC